MRRLTIFIISLAVFYSFPVRGQDQIEPLGESLGQLFSDLAVTPDDSTRIRIADSINNHLEEYTGYDMIFDHSFDHIRFLGQITSTDSLLKIICWNLPLSDANGRYFCYFIRKSPEGKNKVQNLTASYNPGIIRTDAYYVAENWYGALYYAVRPVIEGGIRYWMVLGLDYGNPYMTRKVIDVLSFEDDKLRIGKPWFETEGERTHRKVFEYSSSATMTLRFSSDTSIVFDHLVPLSPGPGESSQLLAPEFSYDAYILSDGLWRFALNVDVRNRE